MEYQEFFRPTWRKGIILVVLLAVTFWSSSFSVFRYPSCEGGLVPVYCVDHVPSIQSQIAWAVGQIILLPMILLDNTIPFISHKYILHDIVNFFIIFVEFVYLYSITCLISNIRVKRNLSNKK